MAKNFQLITLFLIVSINLKAQSFDKIIEILKTCKTVKEFKSKAPNYKETINELDTLIYDPLTTRNIGFGFKQYRDNFTANDNKGNSHSYYLIFLIRNDSIMMTYIKEESDQILNLKKMPKQILIIDNQGISVYLSNRNNIFKTKMTPTKLALDLYKEYTLEFGCGEAGQNYSKESKKMKRYVANKNKIRLNNWLRSANCELQVYGAIGLLMLQKKGTSLTGEEKNILQFLKKTDSKVGTCGGCLYGLTTTFSKEIEGLE